MQKFDGSAEVNALMQSNPEKFSKHIEKLSDSLWLRDLASIADITEKLNILNLDLQGKDKDLAQMMGSGSNDGICESFQSQTDIMDTNHNIFKNVSKTYAAEIALPLKKLSAITTDGLPAMIGRTNGFVALCKKDDSFATPISKHCWKTPKIKQSISSYMQKFDGSAEVNALMQSNPEKFSKHIEKLSDSLWLRDLASIADITEKLNILNLDLQGKDKDLAQMMGSGSNDGICESFQSQTDIMDSLPGAIGELYCQPIHHEATETSTAIARIIASDVENLELEIVDLKNDIILQAHSTDVDFWKLVEKDMFPLLRSVAYKIKSCFGSIYLCETLFSTMNIIKLKNQSRLTNSHLNSCLRAGTSAYLPNIHSYRFNIPLKILACDSFEALTQISWSQV
ncbi:hypothetical protein J437_LFUL019749 [Ladona fulva]|nr:hypothetical protein J437_LFUL019749 [Ladona fulva]